MTSETRKRVLQGFAKLFALAPFVLGFIRYTSRAQDLRVMWLAAASFAGAALVFLVSKARDRGPDQVPRAATLIGIGSVAAAVVAAWLLWSLVSVGVMMFAAVFGISWAVSYVLAMRARHVVA
jgi:hypothetical protein